MYVFGIKKNTVGLYEITSKTDFSSNAALDTSGDYNKNYFFQSLCENDWYVYKNHALK